MFIVIISLLLITIGVLLGINKRFCLFCSCSNRLGNLEHELYAAPSNADGNISQDDSDWAELEWRKDGYKRSFSNGDVVTFYETDSNKNIWKGYMIVDSFALKNGTLNVIPKLMFSSKSDKILSQYQSQSYLLELINKDMYYDSTKYEIDDFIKKLQEANVGLNFIKQLEEKRDSIIGDGIWWKSETLAERYADEEL